MTGILIYIVYFIFVIYNMEAINIFKEYFKIFYQLYITYEI